MTEEEYRENHSRQPKNLNEFWKRECKRVLDRKNWAMLPTNAKKWAEGAGH